MRQNRIVILTPLVLAASSEPDNVARATGALALLVVIASLWISWRTYRRSGVRVVVTNEKMLNIAVAFVVEPIYDDVLTVSVRNRMGRSNRQDLWITSFYAAAGEG